jgi:hypothetical protein
VKLLVIAPPVAGRPLAGRAGRLLSKELAHNGITGSDFAIVHMSENLVFDVLDRPGVPLLALGKLATLGLLGVRNFPAARGFVWDLPGIPREKLDAALRRAGILPSKRARAAPTEAQVAEARLLEARAAIAGRHVVPTLEPGEALDVGYPLFRADVARAARVARGLVALEDEGSHEVGGPEILEGLGPVVACDIETDGIDIMTTRVLCVGVTDGARVAVLWPWRGAWAPALSAFLGSRGRVVFHNAGFDVPVLENNGVAW